MCLTAVTAISSLVTNKQTNLYVRETAVVLGFKKKPASGDSFVLKGGPSSTERVAEVGLGAFLCCLSCSYLADRSYQPSGLVSWCSSAE